jgi:hypothetical protein
LRGVIGVRVERRNYQPDLSERIPSLKIIANPERYGTSYMLGSGAKRQPAEWLGRHAYWALPGYIWVLRKETGG